MQQVQLSLHFIPERFGRRSPVVNAISPAFCSMERFTQSLAHKKPFSPEDAAQTYEPASLTGLQQPPEFNLAVAPQ